MALDLSKLDRSVLARSPLTSVIFQLRFDHNPRGAEAEIAQALHEALGGAEGALPKLDQIMEGAFNFTLGAGLSPAVSQATPGMGWRLSSADGTTTVSLLPSSVAIESSTYESWDEDFGPRLDQVLAAVQEHVKPVFEQRVGLRYINQITDPEVKTAEEWKQWIDPHFLGVAIHDEIGSSVAFARQQVQLQLDDDVRCTLNHGFASDPERDGSLTYLLDFDVSREGTRPVDMKEIRQSADLFNSYALRLFQLSSTPQLRQHLTSS